MFVQVKDYFAVLFCLEQKSPFLKKRLKSATVKLDIYCQRMNKSGDFLPLHSFRNAFTPHKRLQ